MSTKPLRISHVITGLSTGGAETMPHRLLTRIDPGKFQSEVISLTGDAPTGEKSTAAGCPLRLSGTRSWLPEPLRLR